MTRRIAGGLLLGLCLVQTALAAAPVSGTAITNRAEATYVPFGQFLPETLFSNVVTVKVATVESLALTSDTAISRPVGAPLTLQHLLSNTGNVASVYSFDLKNLPGDNFDLAALSLVQDVNGNGRADAGEPVLPFGAGVAVLTLAPGESAALLVLGTIPLSAGSGIAGVSNALVRLTAATTGAVVQSASVTDTVSTGRIAAVLLDKQADQTGVVVPGTLINYRITATNTGDVPATATAVGGLAATPILIDGIPATVFLLHDTIPAGTSFVPGTLSTSLPGALRLYRLPVDAPYQYRTNGDDAAAIEVAVAVRNSVLNANVTTTMGFAVRVLNSAAASAVSNTAYGEYGNGSAAASATSNTVSLRVMSQAIGLAERADPPIYEHDASNRLLGTARVRLSFVLENFGSDVARDVQLRDVLAAPATFGRYTTSATPGLGEYTVLPPTFKSLKNRAAVSFNAAYTGDATNADLLAAGNILPPGGAVEISFEVRINVQGRDGLIFNSAQATASVGLPAYASLRDDSVNGSVPDANGDGIPGNDTSPTPILLSLPSISVDKTTSAWRRLEGDARRYEIDYIITVTNTGRATASFVQIADQLSCTFRDYLSPAPVRVWSLVATPSFQSGLLRANPGFTGRAPCTSPPVRGGDPYVSRPRDVAVQLTDGTRHLTPGQSEVIRYTVRIELDPLAKAGDRVFDNFAIASLQDSGNVGSSAVVVATQAAALVIPIDPSGVVYNAVTRTAVPGAVVTLSRFSCITTGSGPITEDQLLPVTGIPYQINADGTVSVITDAQGRYFFYLRSPPVLSTCEYRVAVAPPGGSGLTFASRLLPADPGPAPGGPPQLQSLAPTGAQATKYFLRFNLGPGLPDVWNNHIPLDPGVPPNALLIQKSSNRSVIEIGQPVDYTVKVRNIAGQPLLGLELSDQLPPGFRLVPGSTRLDGVATSEPVGAPGASLQFRWPSLLIDAARELSVTYRVVAGIGSPIGPALNRVVARSSGRVSNEASATVRVEGGVFAEEAFVIGKVYLDCSRDGIQGHEEIGIPGVRLLLEDGTGVVTDVEGKFNFYGLRAITRVLKLDTTTLPRGARLGLISNRQAGRADSRFLDLKKGELHKADFAVDNCDATEVVKDVNARRKSLALRPDAEGEAVSQARFNAQALPEPTLTEVRRRAATGEIGPNGPVAPGVVAVPVKPVQVFEPVLSSEDATSTGKPALVRAAAAPLRADLEAVMQNVSNDAAFIDLKDQDTLPFAQSDVRVKGRLGATLRLTVNGRIESELRVGKRIRIADREIEAWEYIGVQFKPGDNEVRLDEIDSFGIVRASQTMVLKVPGLISRIDIEVPATAIADATTAVKVRVRLTDDRGLPVVARTHLTLEASAGRWEAADLNPAEPGTQVAIEGGEAVFMLVPPNAPGDSVVRASTGTLVHEKRVAFLPELRPLIGAGIVEGVIDLSRKGLVPVGMGHRDAFEQTLRNLSSNDGAIDARVAFYFKGTVRGEYLLTTAFDSDKATNERLFRDIQPDKYYPIYGDSAARIFDAQSSGRLYVRVDHQRSWLLYGDFTSSDTSVTGSAVDPRRLSLTNRSATGVKLHHETDRLSMNAYASQDMLSQLVVELPADGTSGPYLVPGTGQWRENSERVEVLVRSRNQSSVILKTLPLQRFTDYVIDPLSRRLLFVAPVASLDENLNPRSIRLTLEVESGGEAFWMGGTDVQFKVNDALQIGATIQSDRDPANPSTLVGATAVLRPSFDPKTTVVAEFARSDNLLNGVGNAGRVEIVRQDNDLSVRAQVSTTDGNFNNPGAGIGPGRTDGSASVQLKLDATNTLRADAIYSEDAVTPSRRAGILVGVSRQIADDLQAEVSTRVSRDSTPGPTGDVQNELFTLRGKLSLRLPESASQVYVEAEQDIRDSDKRVFAFGGDRQLTEKTRLYGRYELISSLGSSFALNAAQQNNVAVLGIDSAELTDGRVFNEFRLRDAVNGREGQYATGVRKALQVSPGLRLTGSAEQTSAFGGVSGNRSTALTGAVDYKGADHYRLFGSLEVRSADTSKSLLNTLGVSYKLDKDWSLLARSTISVQRNEADQVSTTLAKQQLGVAWRQVDAGRWNALARYEHVLNDIDSGLAAEREESHIVSTHVNYQPSSDLTWSGRYAFKTTEHNQGGITSPYWAQLAFGRMMFDITPIWDVSIMGAYYWGRDGTARAALGAEVGMRLVDNLWLSLGYNFAGINDPLLAGSDYLDRGLFLRLRYKFDEQLFK